MLLRIGLAASLLDREGRSATYHSLSAHARGDAVLLLVYIDLEYSLLSRKSSLDQPVVHVAFRRIISKNPISYDDLESFEHCPRSK